MRRKGAGEREPERERKREIAERMRKRAERERERERVTRSLLYYLFFSGNCKVTVQNVKGQVFIDLAINPLRSGTSQ